MKTRHFLFLLIVLTVFINSKSMAQFCYGWYTPVAVSDSVSDNLNPVVVSMNYWMDFQVFWERHTDSGVNEIVCNNYYYPEEIRTVVSSASYNISNPQVIVTANWSPDSDTLAYVFYQTNLAGNEDLYCVIMTNSGFSEPKPFANTSEDETHMRVSQGGGMVWQEGDKIVYSRLSDLTFTYYFTNPQVIDSGDCRNPDIQRVAYFDTEQLLVWEKGTGDDKAIWHSEWRWDLWEWGPPIMMIDDEHYSNPTITKAMYWLSYFSIMIFDYTDSQGLYHYAAYDHYAQEFFISNEVQSIPFQPDLFSMDIPIDEFWGAGYVALTVEDQGQSDIYSNEDYFTPWTQSICQVNSSPQPDRHPLFFQGQEGGDCFDLLCVWESFRNGHWQLFTSATLVIIGGVPERSKHELLELNVMPNPVSAVCTFQCRIDEPSSITVRIIDGKGVVVQESDRRVTESGMYTEEISLEPYPAGIYLLQVTTGQATGSRLIVKR